MTIKDQNRTYHYDESSFQLPLGEKEEMAKILVENFQIARNYISEQILKTETGDQENPTDYAMKLKRMKWHQESVEDKVYWWVTRNRKRISPYIIVSATEILIRETL